MRSFLFTLLFLLTGVTGAWGQTPKVADGIYYIQNNAKFKGYLWPSLTTNTTTGFRYLTTSLTTSVDAVNTNGVSYPAHDESYSHWVVKNVTGGYIQLINPRLNKYVVLRKFPKEDNTKENEYGDRDVWLTDEPATEDLDYTYFVLNNANSPYKISPKAELNGVNSTTGYSFNSATGDDRVWLTWSKSDNKPQNGESREGLIQFYSGGTPLWSFNPDLLDAPTISDVDVNNTVTITDANGLPEGYQIRYTTDGSTIPTASTGTVYSGAIPITSPSVTIKAVVIRYGIVLTEVGTKEVSPVVVAPMVTNNEDGTITLSTFTPNSSIYYTTDGSEPSSSNGTLYESPFSLGNATVIKAISYYYDSSSTVTTYNVPQYTIPTISFNSTTSLVTITSGGTVYYTTDSSTPTTASTPYSEPFSIASPTTIKAITTHAGYLNSEIATLSIEQAATPTIQNIGNNAISITCATAGATIYYTTDGTTDPTTASTPYTEPFVINKTTTIKAIAVKENCINSAVATESFNMVTTPTITFDRITNKATISTTTDGATIYYTTDGSEPSTSSSAYSVPIIINTATTIKAIAVKSSLINSEVSTLSIEKAATPTVSLDYTTGAITITSATDGADIYYTTNGTDDPAPNSNPVVGTKYVGPFVPTTAVTIKAIAIKENTHIDSEISEGVHFDKVETPEINVLSDGSAVTITCSTSGATIHYTTDGSTPTNSSPIYYQPLRDNISGNTIKAIATKTGMIISDVATASGTTLKCATPVITRETGNKFSISCSFPTEGVTIYYTTDETDPTTSSAQYSEPVSFTPTTTVKAIAVANNYDNSTVATKTFTTDVSGGGTAADPFIIESSGDFELFVTKVNNGTGASAYYKVTTDFSAAGCSAVSVNFTGTFDGGLHTISYLSNPLFTSASGATIKNVILDNVSISKEGNVGAIVCEAKGYTRIYNCGILPNDATFPEGTHPSVEATGTSGCAGSIVGRLEDDSRVVNCFSYADVESSGTAAGIVGNNTYASDASVSGGKYTKLKTMVVNCMYYGNITASITYPVYGGQKINNKGANAINNYNFYSVGCQFSPSLAGYNCSWPAQLEYLTRYEFHRNLLNSNRELCGWWVGAPSAPSTMTTAEVQAVTKDASLIAKWVLDRDVAPYPILKPFGKYASPVNIDADALWRMSANEWEGKNLGSLDVTVSGGAHHAGSESLELPITDMDTLRADYCYKKVQLPYYNSVFGNPNGSTWAEKYGDNYGDYVVVGWMVSASGGTTGELVENWETGYNFADRNCTAKDANRVFAQGGYYYVPEGVTSITITAQWAKAIYLDNTGNSYDRVYMSGSKTGTHFAPAGTRPSLGNGKTVLTDNLRTLASTAAYIGDNVYDNAVVLVGNHQYRHDGENIGSTESTKGFTVMSSDFDFDEEPDHCLIWQLGNKTTRQAFCPIRFDFLPVEEIGMAMKEDGSTQYYALGCYRPLGHFEVTETSLIHFGQFEFSNKNRTIYAPLILNAGIFDQYTKGTYALSKDDPDDKIDYIIIGGNVRIPSFTPGAHVNGSSNFPTRHCAVNVIGGSIDNLYLTGNFNEKVKPNADNPHCYIDGGRIKHVAAAGKEGINGNVYFKINHAKIWEFYGGSTMDLSTGTYFKTVKGNIDVTIDNSIVDKYCGGPKFGDMVYDESNPANSKTITTNATNTTFGVYYGGGNGGTSYVQYDKTDVTGDNGNSTGTYNWNGTGNNQGHLDNYVAGTYRSGDHNYMADYDTEIVNISTGTEKGQAVCRTYFYAAQFSATNTGPITNNLTNCTVLTNFYGGGNLGGVKGTVTSTLTGTHVHGSAFGAGFSASIPEVTIHNRDKVPASIDINTGIITPQSGGTSTTYTWTNETSLGGQTLSTSHPAVLDVDGVVGNNYFYTEIPLVNLGTVTGDVSLTIDGTSTVAGNVFGGGNESKSLNNTTVNINGGTISSDVYGGGNQATVGGGTTVNLHGGTISHNVFGGGRGVKGSVAADVGGNVLVTLNETPTITGGVPSFPDNCVVKGDIFGCNNYYGSPKGSVTVHVYKTQGWAGHNVSAGKADDTIEKTGATYEVHAVYGGGNEAAYVPDPDVSTSIANVIIDGCTLTSIEYVYGGGNAAPAPGTHVTVNSCYEIGTVFGGGNGLTNLEDGSPNPGANVGYKTFTIPDDATDEEIAAIKEAAEYGTGISYVELKGGTIHKAFGGSNTKGNIRVKGTVDLNEPTPITCPLEVEEVYGAGNEAEQDGSSEILLGCISYLKEIYGGARKADINNNVVLTIQSGRFDRVFGGNNLGGKISGTITVNIEETGCHPIIIGQLFGGGNQAAYTAPSGQHGPTVNVKSFTSIGEIYGGGYGETAVVKGDTYININECIGDNTSNETTETVKYTGKWINYDVDIVDGQTVTQKNITLYQPAHTAGAIGTIGNVFGGGNEAEVDGSTNIHIGLLDYVPIVSYDPTDVRGYYTRSGAGTQANPYTYGIVTGDAAVAAAANTIYYKPVTGVNITGNVYGGGNAAEVTGDTNVLIGTEEPTTNP